MSISDPGGLWNLGRLCVGALQGDGGLAGGKGTDVIRNGWQSGGDAASRIPGGKVWPLLNILWSYKWIKLNWILDYLFVVGLWKRFLRSFKPQSQRWNKLKQANLVFEMIWLWHPFNVCVYRGYWRRPKSIITSSRSLSFLETWTVKPSPGEMSRLMITSETFPAHTTYLLQVCWRSSLIGWQRLSPSPLTCCVLCAIFCSFSALWV